MGNSDTAVLETIRDAVGHAGAGGVFGEPVSRDGITLLPAAKLSGGGGGGTGEGGGAGGAHDSASGGGKRPHAEGTGTGGGFGVSAKPVGVFVIKDGGVGWRPAVDVNKVILGGQAVAIAALLTIRTIVQARSLRAHPHEERRRWPLRH